MKYLILILILFILACAGPLYEISVHALDGWRVIYNDQKTIDRLCGSNSFFGALGCADVKNKVIYCTYGDDTTCGHELRHATGYRH